LKVAKANVLAQAVSLIAAPLLTRLYSPADFGTVAIFTSLLSVLLAFSTLRFEWSVPNAGSRSQAAALIVLGLSVLIICSIIASILLWLFGSKVLFRDGFQTVEPFLFLLPVALAGSGLIQLMNAWFIREADLTAVSNTKIVQSASGTGLSVIGGVAALGPIGLIMSSIASAWLGFSFLFKHAIELRSRILKLSIKRVRVALVRFGRESTISTAVSIVNTANLAAVPLVLAQHYSTVEIGWYSIMQRLALGPVGLLTAAMGQSFWSEAASLVKTDRQSLRKIYLKTSKRLALAALPISMLCFLGPFFIGPLLGRQWYSAGYILAALAPSIAAQIMVQPITHLIVHRRQHWKFFLDVCKLAFTLLIIIVSIKSKVDFPLLVISLSALAVVSYSILYYLNYICLSK